MKKGEKLRYESLSNVNSNYIGHRMKQDTAAIEIRPPSDLLYL